MQKNGGVGVYIFLAIIFVLGMMLIGGFFGSIFKKAPVEVVSLEDAPTAEAPLKVKPLEFARGPDKPITVAFYNDEGAVLVDVKPVFSCSGLTLAGQSTNLQSVVQGAQANWVVMVGIPFATMSGRYDCTVKVHNTERIFSFNIQ